MNASLVYNDSAMVFVVKNFTVPNTATEFGRQLCEKETKSGGSVFYRSKHSKPSTLIFDVWIPVEI